MPTINMIATGQNIDAMRKARGFSMRDLQEIFGFGTVNTIYTWCRGTKLPSIDNLVLLADVFGVRIDDLLAVDGRQEVRDAA